MAWYDDFKKENGVVMVKVGEKWIPQSEYIKSNQPPKPQEKKKPS